MRTEGLAMNVCTLFPLGLCLLLPCLDAQVFPTARQALGVTATEPFQHAIDDPIECLKGFGGLAKVCTPDAPGILVTEKRERPSCTTRPHGDAHFLATVPAAPPLEIHFNTPVYGFGGFFASDDVVLKVRAEIHDPAGNPVYAETLDLDADCDWVWHGWKSHAPIGSIVFYRPTGGGGGIFLDDLVLDETPPLGCQIGSIPDPSTGVLAVSTLVQSSTHPTATAFVEYSTDGGSSWLPATPAPGSPTSNPTTVAAGGVTSLDWDTRADGIGLVTPATTVLRVTLHNAVPLRARCATGDFVIDNSAPFCATCGDCSGDGLAFDVRDALVASQLAVGVRNPTRDELACCDTDASGAITVVDALALAQRSAGIPSAVMCP